MKTVTMKGQPPRALRNADARRLPLSSTQRAPRPLNRRPRTVPRPLQPLCLLLLAEATAVAVASAHASIAPPLLPLMLRRPLRSSQQKSWESEPRAMPLRWPPAHALQLLRPLLLPLPRMLSLVSQANRPPRICVRCYQKAMLPSPGFGNISLLLHAPLSLCRCVGAAPLSLLTLLMRM